jgi:hypothetical protein
LARVCLKKVLPKGDGRIPSSGEFVARVIAETDGQVLYLRAGGDPIKQAGEIIRKASHEHEVSIEVFNGGARRKAISS